MKTNFTVPVEKVPRFEFNLSLKKSKLSTSDSEWAIFFLTDNQLGNLSSFFKTSKKELDPRWSSDALKNLSKNLKNCQKKMDKFLDKQKTKNKKSIRSVPGNLFFLKSNIPSSKNLTSDSTWDNMTLTQHFDGGGVYKISFLNPLKEPSFIQAHLRQEWADLVSEFKGQIIRVQLTDSIPDDQRRGLDWLGFLSVTTRWKPIQFPQKQRENKEPLQIHILTDVDTARAKKIIDHGIRLGQANNQVRSLAELPANYLRPQSYLQYIRARTQKQKVKLKSYDKNQLQKMGAGAFHAVLRASPAQQGALVHLVRSSKKKHSGRVALVGKGLCFDTGGYNVKTGSYMLGMQQDMTGSAVAFSTFEFLCETYPELEVHAFLALAENLIAPEGFKPNEVVTALNGMTIEVINTDAEGRMVLSDTLVMAQKVSPDLIIDFATLTGSAIRSIGTGRSAVFSNRSELLNLCVSAGERSGEKVWPFPIGSEFEKPLKSKVADTVQCLEVPSPDHIMAATFLNKFVDENMPWIHCDLSAAENSGGLGLIGTKTTGFGVRWAVEVIQQYFRL